MKLLVIGGTQFVGRHLVADAMGRGHDVTLFNRGITAPDLFPEAGHIRGDRSADIDALKGHRFDAVVDTSGYLPRKVRRSVVALRESAPFYTFVSSISVYADFSKSGLTEASAVAQLSDPESENVAEDYGALKALCDAEVRSAYGDAALIVRPGLIVGPFDPTNRFTYWVARAARGGNVLAPGPPEAHVQFVDARDLARWTLDMVENRRDGTFNVTGPERPLTMRGLLGTCVETSGGDARIVWIDPDQLVEREVGSWMELPLWAPEPELRGLMEVDISKALEMGLRFRSLEETVRDTLAWIRSIDDPPGEAGMSEQRERELLAELA